MLEVQDVDAIADDARRTEAEALLMSYRKKGGVNDMLRHMLRAMVVDKTAFMDIMLDTGQKATCIVIKDENSEGVRITPVAVLITQDEVANHLVKKACEELGKEGAPVQPMVQMPSIPLAVGPEAAAVLVAQTFQTFGMGDPDDLPEGAPQGVTLQ